MHPLSWQDFRSLHQVGDIVEGRVKKVVAFGVFLEVDGFDGLLVGSEKPEVGASLTVRITGIDDEKSRFSLTMA